MKFKRLTLEEREKIRVLVNQDKTNQEISLSPNRSNIPLQKTESFRKLKENY